MLLVKGILLHVLQRKSWRQAATELHMASHIPLYQFYEHIRHTPEGDEIIEYMIYRRIALHLRDARHITPEILDSECIVEESIHTWREMI